MNHSPELRVRELASTSTNPEVRDLAAALVDLYQKLRRAGDDIRAAADQADRAASTARRLPGRQ